MNHGYLRSRFVGYVRNSAETNRLRVRGFFHLDMERGVVTRLPQITTYISTRPIFPLSTMIEAEENKYLFIYLFIWGGSLFC